MASLDIGIDLGTSTIIASASEKGVIIKEPSVIAVNKKSGEILDIGKNAYKMVGRTHRDIEVVRPMGKGVISNYAMTEALIRHLLRKVCKNQFLKPRVIVCVPSVITGVESQSVIDATVKAGARQVYLMEEPVAAAIGAGVHLERPNGNLIVDIGGGTSDIAVLSLNGIVCKTSLRIAGEAFDLAIARYLRGKYNLLIGEKTMEEIKINIGSVYSGDEDAEMEAKGRGLVNGLPTKVVVTRKELRPYLRGVAMHIVASVQGVVEKTPPELVGDIRDNGIILTGGGSLITGLDRLLEAKLRIPARIAENPVECVAIGTARGFSYLGTLFDGFVHTSTHIH